MLFRKLMPNACLQLFFVVLCKLWINIIFPKKPGRWQRWTDSHLWASGGDWSSVHQTCHHPGTTEGQDQRRPDERVPGQIRLLRAPHHQTSARERGGWSRLSLRHQHRADEGWHPDSLVYRGWSVQRQLVWDECSVSQGCCPSGESWIITETVWENVNKHIWY